MWDFDLEHNKSVAPKARKIGVSAVSSLADIILTAKVNVPSSVVVVFITDLLELNTTRTPAKAQSICLGEISFFLER